MDIRPIQKTLSRQAKEGFSLLKMGCEEQATKEGLACSIVELQK